MCMRLHTQTHGRKATYFYTKNMGKNVKVLNCFVFHLHFKQYAHIPGMYGHKKNGCKGRFKTI